MELIRLVDRVARNSMIENQTFEDLIVAGPAVIAPLGGGEMVDCSFDGDPDSLFIEIPEGRRVIGVIGLNNVIFRRCRFQNVAIAGTPEAIAEFKKGFTSP